MSTTAAQFDNLTKVTKFQVHQRNHRLMNEEIIAARAQLGLPAESRIYDLISGNQTLGILKDQIAAKNSKAATPPATSAPAEKGVAPDLSTVVKVHLFAAGGGKLTDQQLSELSPAFQTAFKCNGGTVIDTRPKSAAQIEADNYLAMKPTVRAAFLADEGQLSYAAFKLLPNDRRDLRGEFIRKGGKLA